MRRPLIALAVPVLVIIGAAGCSKESTTSTNQAQGTTTQAPATSAASKTTQGKTSDTKTSDSKTTSTTSKSSNPGDISIPDMGQLQKCAELATAYGAAHAALALGAASQDQFNQAQAELEKVKANVPENIRDDFEIIEQGLKDNAGNMTAIANFLNSDEYKNADKEITDYLEKECSKLEG